jgi:hypothetical protein
VVSSKLSLKAFTILSLCRFHFNGGHARQKKKDRLSLADSFLSIITDHSRSNIFLGDQAMFHLRQFPSIDLSSQFCHCSTHSAARFAAAFSIRARRIRDDRKAI